MPHDISTVLTIAGIPNRVKGKNVGRGFVNVCCPFCDEGRFHCGINTDKLWFKCFVCNTGGSWTRLGKELSKIHKGFDYRSIEDGSSYIDHSDYEPVRIIKGFAPIYIPLNWVTDLLSDRNLNYFDISTDLKLYSVDKGRKCLAFGDGSFGKRIIWYPRGNPKYKKYFDEKVKDDRHWLFGLDSFKGGNAVIVEGLFDMISARMYKIPAIAALTKIAAGTKQSEDTIVQLLAKNIQRVTIAFDRDVGYNATHDLAMEMRDSGIDTNVFDWRKLPRSVKDFDEARIKSPHKFLQCVDDLRFGNKLETETLL